MIKSVLVTIVTTLLLATCNKNDIQVNDGLIANYYYRLALIDLDSTVNYSEIVTTKMGITKLEIPGDANEDGKVSKSYCRTHPNDPRCKALPVVLEYFMLSNNNNVVTLSWKSATEDNFDRYVVERCRDAINYKPIATIKGAGPGTYVYKDIFK